MIAANRIGLESVEPCEENGGQRSALQFYGTSFMATQTGAVAEQADRESECILMHSYDLDAIAQHRLDWGIYRDRRPHCYTKITEE